MIKKKLTAISLAFVLAVSTIAVPMSASAQITYDPLPPNHGIYIDTSEVPKPDNGDIVVDESAGTINVKRNVTFKLNCSVDASWSIKADDTTNTSVRDGAVAIDSNSGIVSISKLAAGGVYTVTATPENVETVKAASYEIVVNAKADAATATNIEWDPDAMDCPQFSVSSNGKILTIDGHVDSEKIAVKHEPAYILDTVRIYSEKNTEVYDLVQLADGVGITTKTVTDDEQTSVKCQIGTGNAASSDGGLKVIVKRQNLKVSLECNELETSKTYDLMMNQDVNYTLVSNDAQTLPIAAIKDNKATWTMKKGNDDITPLYQNALGDQVDAENATKIVFPVIASNGVTNKQIAQFIFTPDGKNLQVLTTTEDVSDISQTSVELTGKYQNTAGTGDTTIGPFTFNFNPAVEAKFSKAELKFESTPRFVENLNYAVEEERLGGELVKVYYFEADNTNLNLAAATYADVPGVRTFESSKNSAFASGQKYSITYELSDLPDTVFGSKQVAKKYNNSNLNAGELNDDNTLRNNRRLTKRGIGYKQLTVSCKQGTKPISSEIYVLRFVSPSGDFNNLSVDKRQNVKYAPNETVHVRQGEALTPYIDVAQPIDITVYNPYFDYSISEPNVANIISDTDGKYKISGLNAGMATVTVTGKVNKANVATFELYVNKDLYAGAFGISFSDAILSSKMDENHAINGKYDSIPVNVVSLETNAGIPKLRWSLDCSADIAVIDENTGVITTKKSSQTTRINVTATPLSGGEPQTDYFTIKEVFATGISVLAEDVASGALPVVESTTDNAGSCKVGDTFTMYPKTYIPVNATSLSGKPSWSSTNTDVATVTDSGVVTAIGPGTTKIVASYSYGGNAAVTTEYNLNVAGKANSVTGIKVDSTLKLNRIGATATIEASVVPADAENQTLKYVSSNDKIATVSESGVVTAVDIGTCTITVSSVAVPSVSKVITVTVGGEADSPVNIETAKTEAIAAINAALGSNPSAEAKAAADKAIAAINAATTSDAVLAAKTSGETAVKNQIAADKAAADKAAADKAAADKAAAEQAAIEKEKADFKAVAPKISSVKNSKKKAMVVKVKNIAGARFEVSYGTKSNFKGAKKKNGGASVTIKSLKKGKTYYVRVRAFKTIGGEKVYSKYSAKKKVKIKK